MTEEEKKASGAMQGKLSDEELEEVVGGLWYPGIEQDRKERMRNKFAEHLANGGTREEWSSMMRNRIEKK